MQRETKLASSTTEDSELGGIGVASLRPTAKFPDTTALVYNAPSPEQGSQ
jgi:hypothetical protein